MVIQKTKQDVELTEDAAGRRWQASTCHPAGDELVPVFQINGQNVRYRPVQFLLPLVLPSRPIRKRYRTYGREYLVSTVA